VAVKQQSHHATGERTSGALIQQMQFEWDENKNARNLEKHGIDFVKAKDVFADPNSVTFRSGVRHSEERYLTIGIVDDRLITVVFTIRNDRTRIISARRARKKEREVYGN
jgi:hypothetical protein